MVPEQFIASSVSVPSQSPSLECSPVSSRARRGRMTFFPDPKYSWELTPLSLKLSQGVNFQHHLFGPK